MNSKATFSLSDYQRATLAEMGITVWSEHETPAPTPQDELHSLMVNNSKIEPISAASNIASDPSILPRYSLPEHILFPEHFAIHPLFTDILTAMGLQEKPRRAMDDSGVKQYSDYLLVWQVADHIVLDGTTLTTPELSSLSCVEPKKQLWRALQAYKQQNRPA
ncbi:MAG: hypothetical protein ACI965_001161 [Paraglaciecola sp.]|jgi:hypothetical protein